MTANTTRAAIVNKSLQRAGRGNELKSLANEMLNDVLHDLAYTGKYPVLHKIGALTSLPPSTSTVALPSDFGIGMDSLAFDDQIVPLVEYTKEEFADAGFMKTSINTTGRPVAYTIDLEGGLIRFDVISNIAYTFIPIYYKIPDAIPLDATGDNFKPWFPNDLVLVQKLIAEIYQFTEDPREIAQDAKADKKLAEYQRANFKISGGSSRLRLAPQIFRRRQFKHRP